MKLMNIKLRKDSWTANEDKLLKEIVINKMNQGKTQVSGFEEAGTLLGRSKQACAFRWNKYIRPLIFKSDTNVESLTSVSEAPIQNHLHLAMENYNEMQQSVDKITKEYNLLKRDYEQLINWARQGKDHIPLE